LAWKWAALLPLAIIVEALAAKMAVPLASCICARHAISLIMLTPLLFFMAVKLLLEFQNAHYEFHW
jgi:mannose/fructose/N-acetylgalactosamine-specific phosphotransferase system component IID